MILIKPSFEIMEIMGVVVGEDITNPNKIAGFNFALQLIEKAGRTCYKSEDKITQGSAEKFVRMVRDRGHHSVLEHSAMTVKFIVDRGVTHEWVRHRLCAFSQESTRFCNYKGGVTFVIPPWVVWRMGEYDALTVISDYCQHPTNDEDWLVSMARSEMFYTRLILGGWSPQQARSVLPNSLKTELVVTANFREWRHIFTLRCSIAAHPQMREIMIPLLNHCKEIIPVIFEDIEVDG